MVFFTFFLGIILLKTIRITLLWTTSLCAGNQDMRITQPEKTIDILESKLLNLGSSRILFNENEEPSALFLQLLEAVGKDSSEKSENSIEKINSWAQKNLLRQGERWQEQTARFEKLKPIIEPLLVDLGFINDTHSHFQEYQGALIHGGLLPRVRLRLHYLILEWNLGIRFANLYFLSGDRPLETLHENRETFMQDEASPLKIRKNWKEPSNLPKTENEMIQLVWEQSEIPEDMRQSVKVHFIRAPMKDGINGVKTVRPTTDDAVEAWLKTAPIHGRYLAVTNAPYTNRQDVVIRTIAPSEYSFETIGSRANPQEQMAIFLDELARLIFQTKQLIEKHPSK